MRMKTEAFFAKCGNLGRRPSSPDPVTCIGPVAMPEAWRNLLSASDDFSVTAQEYREIDAQRILVLVQFRGRTKTGGLELGHIAGRNASLLDIEHGTVRRLALCWDRDRALTELDLKE
jgi:hypothetical protein